MARILGIVLAALLVVMGVLFVVAAAASGAWPRYVLGGVLLTSGLVLMAICCLTTPRTPEDDSLEVDEGGELSSTQLKCRKCGSELQAGDVQRGSDAAMVSCSCCRAQYLID